MTYRIESSSLTVVKFSNLTFSYRWVCDECDRKGTWITSENEAKKSGRQHDAVKHIGTRAFYPTGESDYFL